MNQKTERDDALAKWQRECEGASVPVTPMMRHAYRDGWDDALASRPDSQSASEDGSPHPCPFCGSSLLQKNDHGYYVHPAGECFLREFEFGDDAVSAWNRRASSPDAQADERGAGAPEPKVLKVIDELYEEASERLKEDRDAGVFADTQTADLLTEWAGRLELTQTAFYEDVYGQLTDMLEPHVRREGINDKGQLPASVVESMSILLESWQARAAAPQAAHDQHEKSDLYKEGYLAGKAAASAPSPDREQVGEDTRRVDELSMLIRQLVHALRKAAPDNDLAGRAGDYLKRAGLQGSPLRVEAPDAPPSRECGEQQECPHGVDDGACGWCYDDKVASARTPTAPTQELAQNVLTESWVRRAQAAVNAVVGEKDEETLLKLAGRMEQLLREVLEGAPTLGEAQEIDALISIWSMRPQPGTPCGDAWEEGARKGFEWGWKYSPAVAPAQGEPVAWPYEITRGHIECLIADHQRDGQKHLKSRLNSSGSYLIRVAESFRWCLEQIDAAKSNAHPQPITDAARDVLAERYRQVTAEGWTPAHDDEHTGCSLAVAAACYALFAAADNSDSADAWLQEWRKTARYLWPYDKEWQKTTTPRRDLVKAGALILAEIERLDRAKGE